MGNNAIIIRTVGCHHNGRADIDAEQIAKRCVDELRAAGHSIVAATVETGGGSIDIDKGNGQLRGFDSKDGALVPYEGPDPKWALTNPDAPARAAYERYLKVTGGLNYEGKPCPKWDDLGPTIRAAWMAAVDHTKSRLAP
jgi:hypothetical protein